MEIFNSFAVQLKLFVLSLFMFAQLLVSTLNNHPPIVVAPAPLPVVASSTPHITAATSTLATSTSKTIVPKTTTIIATNTHITKAAPVVVASTTAVTPVALIPTEQLNEQTRATLVNILCTTKAGGSFAPISGSGVVIDTRGIILTNAHVAQYFLLRNYGSADNVQCVVRTGSPASPAYTAELLYLPPSWINLNASQITSQQAIGTGENDYTFLRITGTVSPNIPLPSIFTALALSSATPARNDAVFLAGYPAGFLGGTTIQTNLYASSANSSVQDLYTFNDPKNIDLIALAGTVVAQSGSSGGAVVNAQTGKLIGIIATETQGTTTSSRILNAITVAHINRSLISAGLGGITGLLSANAKQQAIDFAAETAPGEIKSLETELNKTLR